MSAVAAPPATRVTLLGGFSLSVGGEPVELPRSAQRLVSFLALNPRRLMRAFVAGTLWTEAGEEQAGSSLRSALWRLPKDVALLEATPTQVGLAAGVGSDVAEALDLSRRVLGGEAPPAHRDVLALSEAGELLPGWYDDWLIVERERVRQRRLHTLEAACRRLTDASRFADALEVGLAAVAMEPLRESAHAAVIRAHRAEGNLIEASRQYEQLRDMLREHLGTRPSERVLELLRT